MSRGPDDPRNTITPESFGVAKGLLGLPLAGPVRRAAAMACDLVPLVVLIKAGGAFFGVIAAIILWRASTPAQKQGFVRGSAKGLLRLAAALVLFIVILKVWGAWFGSRDARSNGVNVDAGIGTTPIDFSLGDIRGIREILTLRNARDSAAIADAAEKLAQRVRSLDTDEDTRRKLAATLVGEISDSAQSAGLRRALGPLAETGTPELAADSAVLAYAGALAVADTPRMTALEPAARDALAGAEIRSLERARDRARTESERLQRRLEEAESSGGIVRFIRGIADDLGLGFGWGALYFTSFLALWGGQTPGKRLLGLRVIRLDGKPIGWWLAFERFGGYAASLSTGTLGFLQILWDRNRQGLHDKAAETVVILESRSRAAAAAPPAAR
jgi:hypothetical protein